MYIYDQTNGLYKDTITEEEVSDERLTEIAFDRLDTAMIAMFAYLTSFAVQREPDLQLLSEFWRQEIKDVYIHLALLGRGGRYMMTPADWSDVELVLRQEYEYFNQFITDLINGKNTLQRFRTRLNGYINKGYLVFNMMLTRSKKSAGKTEYMRLINSQESCRTCPSKAGRWGNLEILELGLPGDGNDECGSFCRCTIVTR